MSTNIILGRFLPIRLVETAPKNYYKYSKIITFFFFWPDIPQSLKPSQLYICLLLFVYSFLGGLLKYLLTSQQNEHPSLLLKQARRRNDKNLGVKFAFLLQKSVMNLQPYTIEVYMKNSGIIELTFFSWLEKVFEGFISISKVKWINTQLYILFFKDKKYCLLQFLKIFFPQHTQNVSYLFKNREYFTVPSCFGRRLQSSKTSSFISLSDLYLCGKYD